MGDVLGYARVSIGDQDVVGELIVQVFGAIAQFKRRLIDERTEDGIAAARARGKAPRLSTR